MRNYDTMSTNSWVSFEQIHSTAVKRQMFLFQRLPNTPRQILFPTTTKYSAPNPYFGNVSLSSCMYTYGASTRAQLESYKLPTLGLLPLMDLYRLVVHPIVYLRSLHACAVGILQTSHARSTPTDGSLSPGGPLHRILGSQFTYFFLLCL